jgi:tRNA A-37 threonylcarbamoyl transferase component Bud32
MQCPTCHTPVDDTQRFCPSCGTALAAAQANPSAPAIDPLLGQTLGGKYRVLRLLGEGGMGAVYEGEQQLGTAKRKVAVKTLHPHLSRDPKIQARFEREVGTIAELEHPNTIQVYDFGSTPDGILYIVMEFLQGKSLADTLTQQGAMAPDRAEHILAQACGSLEEAHAHGIVHRDLKPDNIVLVERAGQKDFVKVLDFGIAKRANEEDRNEQKLTQQGMVLGTPPYMSPEQFTGQAIDSRSDIYSLGIVAYEMLTGKLPFKADTAWEWATQHMTQPPIPIESLAEGGRVPLAMRNAIARALAKAPADRFQTAQALIAAFSGKAEPGSHTAAHAAALGRQKTEIGTPLDVAAAFGGARPGTPVPHQGYTPAAGNLAFPTPAAIPQAPPRQSGGGGRGVLLAVAGVIGLASIVAIALAVKGTSGGGTKEVVFDNSAAPAPSTTLSATPVGSAAGNEPAPADSSASEVPALNNGTGNPRPAPQPAPHAGPGPAPVHNEPSPAPHPTPQTQPVAPAPQPQPTPQAQPQPLPTPPAATYDGPECRKARTLRALGHPREAQAWALSCTAKGGNP